ncbi:ATP-dependent DNA helicase RecQ [Lactococcus hodotermopsidis]|uniref:DNA helicase RecQ n=1 Tax=Pseudolactococcus hodotermopsidis TaxID=2709157 RepID=A0A6A0BDL2_9LACT|nr:DNA helicase RecQ [Lactococcus hodotermopsidis]GFH42783.1 ATP-dependent DNA helicase RecQ [Lactococcus hodotermopsidis]
MINAQEILKSVYGYDTFRDGQEEIIDSVISGNRTLGIMPTGGGKSLTYQIPAILSSGLTMVVSPLISLMKNQVDELVAAGVSATMINSSLDFEAVKERIYDIRQGIYKIFFVAPERLEDTSFYDFIQTLDLRLVVIDEVHVLSQWGHDFRPSYLTAVDLIENLSNTPNVMALTATATEKVQHDLEHILAIDKTVTTGFARANLAIKIEKGLSDADKKKYIVSYVKNHANDVGIIYAGTRKKVDELSEMLNQSGITAGRYHAGMSDSAREAAQNGFLYDDFQVIVATNAFGMGINKTNVRYVLHLTMPGSIEAYYQEIGRAGRDGLPSESVLLYSARDIQLQRFFIDNSENQEATYRHNELKKLQEMTAFAATQMCLQRYIIQYFGEDMADCGVCTNCTDERALYDVTVDAQKVLSNIVRMSQQRDDAYSRTQVVNVLRGKLAENMLWTGFDKLSTYGLMRDWSLKKLSSFVDYLVADGYLDVAGEYNGLSVSQKGIQVLRGKLTVTMREIKVKETPEKSRASKKAVGGDLFELLRAQRTIFAKELALPPFMVFSDQVLMNLADAKPTNLAEMLNVSGIGEKKADQFGQAFLKVIRDYVG